ncbi:MAG: ATP-binding protein [bacterium]
MTESKNSILNTLSIQLCKSLKKNEILEIFATRIADYLSIVRAVEIYLINDENKKLILQKQSNLPSKLISTDKFSIDGGLPGRVNKTKNAVTVKNLSEVKYLNKNVVEKEGIDFYYGIPLQAEDNVLGVVGYYLKKSGDLTDENRQVLQNITELLYYSLKNANLYEQAEVRTRRYMSISRAIALTRQLGTIKDVLQDISKSLVKYLGFDQSWIGIIDSDKEIIEGKAGYGPVLGKNDINTVISIPSESHHPAVESLIKQEPVIYQAVDDVKDKKIKKYFKQLNLNSFSYVPIIKGEEQSLGVIGVYYLSDQSFSEDSIKTLISVAEYGSFAIENALLYETMTNSEKRYRILFEAAGPSLAIIDKEGVFRLVNKAFVEISGYSKNELIGKLKIDTFFQTNDSSGQEIKTIIDHPPQTCDLEFVDKNNDARQIHLSTTSLTSSSEILISIIDLTRQRELEKRLYRSEELASIGELSASIAHEIRNPLISIINSVNLLEDENQISDDGRQVLEIIREESDHLSVIVDDFLRFARPQKLNQKFEDINELISNVVKRHKEWNEDDITWKEKYDSSLPMIELDRHQFQQVITNLLMNSLDAIGENGKVTVNTRKEERFGVKVVRVSLSDTGIGIPEEEMKKIFQPFFSLKEKGTGMGLAICQRIIDNHNGELLVDSKEGEGTTFSILLPISN